MSTELRRDAEANRQRLISAAIEVFNDEGLDAGVERIAARAGVGIGTLYRRFPTKDALIEYLLAQTLDELIDVAGQAREQADGLERFLRAAAQQLAAQRGCLHRLWKSGVVDQARLRRLRRLIDQLVVAAHEGGALRPEVTRADVTTVLWSLQGVIDNAGPHAHAACDRLITLLVDGLRP